MKDKIEKFLEFNGRRISVLLADGNWWVAIKPICEALNVNYERQRQNIQDDEILSQLPAEQQVVAADGRMRKMLCLPEMYVYGWLFSIRSDSPDLVQYKKLCYDVLYRHFHGTMTGRMAALNKRTETELEIIELQDRLDQKLLESDEYLKIQELKRTQKQIAKTLKDLDADLVSGQLSLNLEMPSDQ